VRGALPLDVLAACCQFRHSKYQSSLSRGRRMFGT